MSEDQRSEVSNADKDFVQQEKFELSQRENASKDTCQELLVVLAEAQCKMGDLIISLELDDLDSNSILFIGSVLKDFGQFQIDMLALLANLE